MTESRTATARRSAASARGQAASRERPDRAAAGSWPVRERSLIGPVLGIPPVVAVALALGLTAIGVIVDLLRVGTVGTVFQIAYGAGCLLAVAWVRRRSLFLPAIQPPLLLAVVVPVLAVLIGAPSSTAGVTEHLLLAGAPLINAFPAMAVTTGLVLLLAGYRLVRQRTGPDDAIGVLRARLSGRGSDGRRSDGREAGGRGSGDRGSGGAGAGRDAAVGRGGRAASAGRAGDGRPAAGRGTDQGTDRSTDRSTDRGTDRGSDRTADRAPERRSASRRTARGEKGGATGRTGSSRTGAGAPDDPTRRGGSPDSGRQGGSRDRARSDDGPPDTGRTSRGSASGGGSRGGRPRGSGPSSGGAPEDRTRSRRPRPSDPT